MKKLACLLMLLSIFVALRSDSPQGTEIDSDSFKQGIAEIWFAIERPGFFSEVCQAVKQGFKYFKERNEALGRWYDLMGDEILKRYIVPFGDRNAILFLLAIETMMTSELKIQNFHFILIK